MLMLHAHLLYLPFSFVFAVAVVYFPLRAFAWLHIYKNLSRSDATLSHCPEYVPCTPMCQAASNRGTIDLITAG